MKLLGITEIAELAVVSRQTVSNWAVRDDSFPRPLADLACGPIWDGTAIKEWLRSTGKISNNKTVMARASGFAKGVKYTHQDIVEAFRGDMQTYLPQVGKAIVCGCFNLQMNPDAPYEVLVGNGPKIIYKANLMMSQGGLIPVFVKHGVNRWEYCGFMRPVSLDRDAATIAEKSKMAVRHAVWGILTFAEGL